MFFGKRSNDINELNHVVDRLERMATATGVSAPQTSYSMPEFTINSEDLIPDQPHVIEATARPADAPSPVIKPSRGRKKSGATQKQLPAAGKTGADQRSKILAVVRQQIGDLFIFAGCSGVVLLLFKNQLVLTSLFLFIGFLGAYLFAKHKKPQHLPLLAQVVIVFGIVLCLFLLGLPRP